MVATATGWGGGKAVGRPFLPRAMSAWKAGHDRLGLLLEAVGPATRRLCELTVGEELCLVGPLGRAFQAPKALSQSADPRPVLVAGGVGVVPIVAWERDLRATGHEPTVLAGFQSSEFSLAASLFEGEVALAVDDGSIAEAYSGRVTDLLEQRVDQDDAPVVYACGPAAMLEVVRVICGERGIPAQLALEAPMACGFGACFGCAVETKEGYIRLCVDGPVVDADALERVIDTGTGHGQ